MNTFHDTIVRDNIVPFLPVHLGKMILSLPAEDLHKLEEIRLRCGQPLMLRFSNRECSLGSSGRAADKPGSEYVVNQQDIQRTIASISDNSLYAFEEEISRGYITIPGGHRIGLAGKAILDGKRVRTLKDFSGIAFRIAREVKDSSLPLLNHICGRNAAINNTLLISPPRCGKTTILRDIVRNLSSGGAWGPGYNITVVDERSEIAGSYRGMAQFDLGPRVDVLDACPKALGMIMAVRSLSPQAVITDEIGRPEDVEAISECINAGVAIITSVHAGNIEEAQRRPWINSLLAQGVFNILVVLSRRQGPGTIEEIVRWDET